MKKIILVLLVVTSFSCNVFDSVLLENRTGGDLTINSSTLGNNGVTLVSDSTRLTLENEVSSFHYEGGTLVITEGYSSITVVIEVDEGTGLALIAECIFEMES